jgi:Ca2+-binding RTX toxin-like protein
VEIYSGFSGPAFEFTNSGTIIADIAFMERQEAGHSGYRAITLINSGLLDGRVELSLVNDQVTNSGSITGTIRLLDGGDVFDGHAGRQASVHGGLGNDQMTGGNGGDQLFGDEGDDVLQAGGGYDWLEGGAGADTFVFTALSDSAAYSLRSDGAKTMPDQIADFTKGSDRIDLGAIDAIAGTGSNDAFAFIGSAAFSHQAGQLRFETAGGLTTIFADVDGDGSADMQIVLATPVALTAADFVL